jgi:uncharacterized protein with NAD-binding domain and iron-sulfur cluster
MTDGNSDPRTRVAILGGGPAGLSAALALSATPALRARFDVTIYQSGWRVGGKCGQGRRGPANRIEINGTHYLFGAYRNVFDLTREVYAELEAAGDTRFGTLESQFLPCDTIAVKEFFNGNWETWVIRMPGDGKPPTGPARDLTAADTADAMLGGIIDAFHTNRQAPFMSTDAVGHATRGSGDDGSSGGVSEKPHWWERVGHLIEHEYSALERLAGIALARAARGLVHALEHEVMKSAARDAVIWLLNRFRAWARDLLVVPAQTHLEAHRLLLLADLGTSILIGMLQDDVFAPGGYEKIDQFDLREWLVRSGARAETAWSAPITTWYNAIAAYEHGDPHLPNMSAGMGLRGLMRLALTWHGAFSFQLSCEVGDSLIAPLFVVLQRRGVRILHFHRVQEIIPAADGSRIDAVRVERQVTLKSGDPASYDPFIVLPDGRPVWPDSPNLDQIQDPPPHADDLLSFYAPSTGTDITLERGRDFDVVVNAMPVATARWSCARLLAQKPEWQAMVENLGTTETQSLRLWLYPTVEEMGWRFGQSVLSGFYQPLGTWEDARQLLATETWPPEHRPGSIATLFGAFPGAPPIYPGPEDTGYPARRVEQAQETALLFCTTYVGSLWPKATDMRNPVGLSWPALVTLAPGVVGAARLAAQSVRGNVGPVEAYTQIHRGTLQYRLRADATGYTNLFIAGDWIRNGYEIGSVEGAVLGGQQAAAALIRGAGITASPQAASIDA